MKLCSFDKLHQLFVNVSDEERLKPVFFWCNVILKSQDQLAAVM